MRTPLTAGGSGKRGLRIEVDIGDERHVTISSAQHARYLTDALGLLHALGREPHIVGPGIGDTLALSGTGLDVVGRRISH